MNTPATTRTDTFRVTDYDCHLDALDAIRNALPVMQLVTREHLGLTPMLVATFDGYKVTAEVTSVHTTDAGRGTYRDVIAIYIVATDDRFEDLDRQVGMFAHVCDAIIALVTYAA